MTYKAEQHDDGWRVTCNGIAILAGLEETTAKRFASDFQREADQHDRMDGAR